MTANSALRACIVDDEPLALDRLERLLEPFPELCIALRTSNATEALAYLNGVGAGQIDVLFLDIEMPEMNGFELLARLGEQPSVIFTTAYDQHALRAFEANTIDYLLKPIDREQLERAVQKLGRRRPAWQQNPDLPALLLDLAAQLHGAPQGYQRRIASRVGDRISFLSVEEITHFSAEDRLTFAYVNGRKHSVDQTIVELERKLDPARFVRVHRSALVNADWVLEMHAWFGGKAILTLKDTAHTQLPVARDRVRSVRERLES